MIPRCFPSIVDGATGVREMVTFPLASIVGLTRWVDYIPVKTYPSAPTPQGTYNDTGYQPVSPLGSTAGLTAWVDYIPTYEDAGATVAWTTNPEGYIPIAASV